MTELQQELFEKQLGSIAKGLDYPRTPDIAGPVMAAPATDHPPGGTGVISDVSCLDPDCNRDPVLRASC